MTAPKHFLDLNDIAPGELRRMLDVAHSLKKSRHTTQDKPLAGKKLAMIFEKTSLRTRVSFEVGMVELGGYPLYLNSGDLQLGRGETIADTARVLSRYVDAILLRCHAHERLTELAQYADIPVINALSDLSHPCQIMADLMTFEEQRGSIKGKKVAWIGDGSNVANSFISAAKAFDFELHLSCPQEFFPDADYIKKADKHVVVAASPEEAARNAALVVTDIWVPMGAEEDNSARHDALVPYQVNEHIMSVAAKDALFMHCLPAHRGEEVTAGVIDGPQSVVWDEAENRLHAQKAILLWCFGALPA